MKLNIRKIVDEISDLNNRYRGKTITPGEKLSVMWQIGDVLLKNGVNQPHSLGWAIQNETKGVIKRPTVFRSYKVRQIWSNKSDLERDLRNIKGSNYFIEILPLIDPQQEVRGKLSAEQLADLFRHACEDSSKQFFTYLTAIKQRYSYKRLGKALPKDRHLEHFKLTLENFKAFQKSLWGVLQAADSGKRESLRAGIPPEELLAFSNMCISLTTKDNYKLYKRKGPESSSSKEETFRKLYECFFLLLDKRDDKERARLRRLISGEALAQMSDMITSIQTEEGVSDFKSRQKLSIGL